MAIQIIRMMMKMVVDTRYSVFIMVFMSDQINDAFVTFDLEAY